MTGEEYLDDLFSRSTIIIDRNRYKYLLFKIGDSIYMDYNINGGISDGDLYCDYDNILFKLTIQVNDFKATVNLIKHKVEEHFKINVSSVQFSDTRHKVDSVISHLRLNGAMVSNNKLTGLP